MTMKFIIELGESRILFKLDFNWIKGKSIYCKNMTKTKVYSLMLMISAKLKIKPD